jgi:AcrR family transcriptional regulator
MARYKQNARDQAVSETRQRLLDAAVVEFSRRGYAEANINRISEAAGFAKGTVYNYFPSKQSLMLTLIEEVGAAHLDFITRQVRAEADPCCRVERFYAAGFAYVEAYPVQAHFLIATLYGAEEEFKQAMYHAYQPMFLLVTEDILAPGIARGEFQVSDPARTAALLMTIYLGTSSNVGPDGKVWLSAKEVAAFVLQALQKVDRTIHQEE